MSLKKTAEQLKQQDRLNSEQKKNADEQENNRLLKPHLENLKRAEEDIRLTESLFRELALVHMDDNNPSLMVYKTKPTIVVSSSMGADNYGKKVVRPGFIQGQVSWGIELLPSWLEHYYYSDNNATEWNDSSGWTTKSISDVDQRSFTGQALLRISARFYAAAVRIYTTGEIVYFGKKVVTRHVTRSSSSNQTTFPRTLIVNDFTKYSRDNNWPGELERCIARDLIDNNFVIKEVDLPNDNSEPKQYKNDVLATPSQKKLRQMFESSTIPLINSHISQI